MTILPASVVQTIRERGHLRGKYLQQVETAHPKAWRKLTARYPDYTVAQRIYHDLGGKAGRCAECGKPTRFHSFTQGYVEHCGHACSHSSEKTQQKKQATIRERYNGQHYMNDPTVRAQFTATMLERHGTEWAMQSTKVRKKSKKTVREKYGTDFITQSKHFRNIVSARKDEINAKRVATYQERLGVNNPLQDRAIHERVNHSGFRRKQFTLKGREFCVQGYEPYVITELVVRLGHNVDDVVVSAADGCQSFWYTYKGKRTRYHPDIMLRHDNGTHDFIEVKSLYTIGLSKKNEHDFSRHLAKLKAASKEGTTWFAIVCLKQRKLVWIKNPHELSKQQVVERLQRKGLTPV